MCNISIIPSQEYNLDLISTFHFCQNFEAEIKIEPVWYSYRQVQFVDFEHVIGFLCT